MKSCIIPTCSACLKLQMDETVVCVVCGGVLVPVPEGSALPAYEAPAPAPAPAPSGEAAPEPTPAPAAEETIPAGERGISDDEAAALLVAARATDEDDAPTPTAPTPAALAVEPVPGPEALGAVVVPVVVQPTSTPVPVTETIHFRPAPSADPAPAPRLAPTPTVDNDAFVARLEDERRQNEARRAKLAADAQRRRDEVQWADRAPAHLASTANDDIAEPASRVQRQTPSAAAPLPTRREPTADLKVPTTRGWWWLVAAAIVLIGVLAWWLLKRNNDGAASQPAIAASDDTSSAPGSSVDPVARNMARNALDGVDRVTTGLGRVSGRVTNLERGQDGRLVIIGANNPSCEYPSFGACVNGLLATGDKRLVESGIITLADAKASAERTCRATGCGAE